MTAHEKGDYNFWRGKRVLLRAITQRDLDAELAMPEEEDSEIERYEADIGPPASPERRQEYMKELMQRIGKDFLFCLVENNAGETVGWISAFECSQRNGTFRYAIAIRRRHWRQGYGRESVQILLRYYFHELRYQKCTTSIYEFNERSQRFHDTLGFKLEGRLRRMYFTNGTYYDELQYGLTAEEWRVADPPRRLE